MHAVFVFRPCDGLADVVQKRSPGQCRIRFGFAFSRQHLHHDQCMSPDIAFRMKTGRLRDPPHPVHFRQNLLQQARLGHPFQPPARSAPCEDFIQFLLYALGADFPDFHRMARNCVPDAVIEMKIQISGKADCPQHS